MDMDEPRTPPSSPLPRARTPTCGSTHPRSRILYKREALCSCTTSEASREVALGRGLAAGCGLCAGIVAGGPSIRQHPWSILDKNTDGYDIMEMREHRSLRWGKTITSSIRSYSFDSVDKS